MSEWIWMKECEFSHVNKWMWMNKCKRLNEWLNVWM